jgi:hypothetical protein
MAQAAIVGPGTAFNRAQSDHRNRDTHLFTLIEIDRASVVDSIRLNDGYELDDVFAMGAMRELCPECKNNHLKLVLRQKRVRHAHLYCECCNKCFDARYTDGSSALELDE